MRLIVARCEVTYTGRLTAYLPDSTRLLMLKDDGSVLVHADAGGYKPLNWMTPPTVFEQGDDTIVVRKRAGRSEDRLEIKLLEVLSDVTHDMGEAAGLQKDGVERDLQLLLADQPEQIDEGLRLVKREWPTEVGPVDLMCRDAEDAWVAVEIKRIGTIDAVEQLSRYLDCIRVDPARTACRGILVAQSIKPQAVALAESRGIGCVEVDLELLRGGARSRAHAVRRLACGERVTHLSRSSGELSARNVQGCYQVVTLAWRRVTSRAAVAGQRTTKVLPPSIAP